MSGAKLIESHFVGMKSIPSARLVYAGARRFDLRTRASFHASLRADPLSSFPSASVRLDGALEIFLVILMAGYMAGIVGMLLAIPSYTVLRVLAKEFFSEFALVQKLTQNI